MQAETDDEATSLVEMSATEHDAMYPVEKTSGRAANLSPRGTTARPTPRARRAAARFSSTRHKLFEATVITGGHLIER